jgi:hypothetical protein
VEAAAMSSKYYKFWVRETGTEQDAESCWMEQCAEDAACTWLDEYRRANPSVVFRLPVKVTVTNDLGESAQFLVDGEWQFYKFAIEKQCTAGGSDDK